MPHFRHTRRGKQAKQAAASAGQICEYKVTDMITYIITYNLQGTPIRRRDMVHHVLKGDQYAFEAHLTEARERLRTMCGVCVFELEKKDGHYTVVDALCKPMIDMSDPMAARKSLILAVLGVIFLAGGVAHQEHIFEVLTLLKMSPNEPHEFLGDIREMVTIDLVREGYINCARARDPNNPRALEFAWGHRTSMDNIRQGLVCFIWKMFNQRTAAFFVACFKEIEAQYERPGKSKVISFMPAPLAARVGALAGETCSGGANGGGGNGGGGNGGGGNGGGGNGGGNGGATGGAKTRPSGATSGAKADPSGATGGGKAPRGGAKRGKNRKN